LFDKQAHCSYCQHTWKPTANVREKIAAQAEYEAEMRQAKASRIERERLAAEAAKAAYARRWRRDASGWVVRDDELDLATLTGDALMAHRDRLTEHLDGLVEAGFVDGTLSEVRHDGYCYEIGEEDDLKIGVCLAECPVNIARQQTYHATAYREHPGQLSLFFT
jgi:hypothetical protein